MHDYLKIALPPPILIKTIIFLFHDGFAASAGLQYMSDKTAQHFLLHLNIYLQGEIE